MLEGGLRLMGRHQEYRQTRKDRAPRFVRPAASPILGQSHPRSEAVRAVAGLQQLRPSVAVLLLTSAVRLVRLTRKKGHKTIKKKFAHVDCAPFTDLVG